MIVSDAYSRIVSKVGTPDDTSSRAINPIVKNSVILRELQDQMRSYANITKGIQDVYSFSQNQNVVFVAAPSLALRSQSYFYAYVIVNATRFPFDFRGPSDVYATFRVSPIQGIVNWVMPWQAGHSGFLSGYPSSSTNAKTTTLSSSISASQTTIPVVAASTFVADFGRITIGTEKILYQYRDATNFYNCERGVEMTTAAAHNSGATVTENNVVLFYARLPESIELTDSSSETIPAATLAKTLEPCDEHLEGIIKAVVFNLLLPINRERAMDFKQDFVALYDMYAKDIRRGFANNRANVNARDPYLSESGIPLGNNLY